MKQNISALETQNNAHREANKKLHMKYIALATDNVKASTEREELLENINKNKKQLTPHNSIDMDVITDLIDSTIVQGHWPLVAIQAPSSKRQRCSIKRDRP